MQIVASTPAQLRALVHDFVQRISSSAHPCWDAQVLVCLAVAARAVGLETNARTELDGSLGRCLDAHGSSRAHHELREAVGRAVDAVSLEYTAPFVALVRLAGGFVFRRSERVRFRTVEGLVGAGDLDGARAVAERTLGFDRSRALRVVDTGVVRESPRAEDRFVALLDPRVLACLSPTADAVIALARRALTAYEPWIAVECSRICAQLDARERARALPHASVVLYFAEGRVPARRLALSIPGRARRADALTLLVGAALQRAHTELALELASMLSGSRRRRAENEIREHVRPRPKPLRPSLVAGIAALPGPYRGHSIAFWLTRAFDQVRGRSRSHPLFMLGARGEVDRPPSDASSDPLSLDRALFDEGVACSPRAASRRRVLVRAAKYALKSAIEGGAVEPEAIDARLRMLDRMGGTLACEAIESVLRASPVFGSTALAALETLAAIDPERGARAFGASQRCFSTRADLDRVATALEHTGALERGFARAWLHLHDRLARGGDRAVATEWLARAADYCASLALPLSPAVATAFTRGVGDRAGMRLLDPETIGSRALAELERVTALPPVRCLDRLLEEPRLVEQLHAFRPARLPRSAGVWNVARACQALDALRGEACLSVDEPLVERFIRATTLRGVDTRKDDFILGRCPFDDALVDLPNGLRLRWLDKRTDILAYVRFADSVQCCLSSWEVDSRDVLLPWCDPLSFVCLVEKRDSSRAVGFVLGGFAWRFPGPAPVMVLNGVYLAQPNTRVRAGILDAFEERIARPLGVVAIGIAAIHGGRGPLPGGYVQVNARLERLRALRNERGLTWEIFDDIVDLANVPLFVSHLYWRELRAGPVRELRYR